MKKKITMLANDPQAFYMHKNQKFLPKLLDSSRERPFDSLEEHNKKLMFNLKLIRNSKDLNKGHEDNLGRKPLGSFRNKQLAKKQYQVSQDITNTKGKDKL